MIHPNTLNMFTRLLGTNITKWVLKEKVKDIEKLKLLIYFSDVKLKTPSYHTVQTINIQNQEWMKVKITNTTKQKYNFWIQWNDYNINTTSLELVVWQDTKCTQWKFPLFFWLTLDIRSLCRHVFYLQ